MLKTTTLHIRMCGYSIRPAVYKPQKHSAYICQSSQMYKILILAYLVGQDPTTTMTTFEMEKQFSSMEECKKELLIEDPMHGTYEVMREFIEDSDFKFDWLAAGCKNDETGDEYILEPAYPKGKPKELIGLEIIPGLRT